mgnify:CR=1 FL=1
MSSKIGVQNIAHTNGTNAMTVSSGGAIALTSALPVASGGTGHNQAVAFNAHRNSGGDISSGNVYVFNSTTVNIGNGFNTSTGKFTAPIAGTYFFNTNVLSHSNTTSNDLQIRVDGTNIAQGRSDVGSAAHNSVFVTVIATLTANQVVDVFVAGGSGMYGSSGQYATFCGHLIGG